MKKFIFISLIIHCSLLIANAQLVSDFRVNDDTTNYNQTYARIGADKQGNFVIVWEDDRRQGHSNIFCQRFDSLAHRLGNNFIINTILDTASEPCIAVRYDGSFGVCWMETNSTVSNRTRIKFRIFSKFGYPISDEIMINDTIKDADYKPSIGTDSTGKFIITFVYFWGSNYDYDIFLQKIDKNGNKIGNNIRVNDDIGYFPQNNPDICVKNDGSCIICWQDPRRPPSPMNGIPNIYMQMYDVNGNKIGNNTLVNDIIYSYDNENDPHISSDSSGNFCVGFTRTDFYSGNYYAKIQLFEKNGIKIGNNINIATPYFDTHLRGIRKRDNGDIVIDYSYYNSSISRVYFERRIISGEIISGEFQVSNQMLNNSNSFYDCEFFKNNIISVFGDYRNGNNDIFCNIRSFLNPDSTLTNIVKLKNNIPSDFKLEQNYPNPFNSMTKIKFNIPNRSPIGTFGDDRVVVVVYDIIGREIETLVNEQLLPGTYEVTFDGSKLASGIYYYQLKTNDFVETRKLVLLK
jgi:hypothetical protein